MSFDGCEAKLHRQADATVIWILYRLISYSYRHHETALLDSGHNEGGRGAEDDKNLSNL